MTPRRSSPSTKASCRASTRFSRADLDASKNACTDFDGYVNGKWLAANPIPGDRTSWGAFEMLDERSNAVQRQLAEQAAADANATGVKKIVGDLWATGMDEAKINAQGIEPLEDRAWPRSTRWPTATRSPSTCARRPRRARASCSASGRSRTSRTRR